MEIKVSDKKIFEILCLDKVFFKVYIKDCFERYFKEEQNRDIVIEAFLTFYSKKIIDISDLINLGDSINFNDKVFGFRNFNYFESDSKINSNKNTVYVYRKVQTLLNCYNGFWCEINPIEKEAYFHIQLLRITPFAHNNELIIQLMLMANLINDFIPPFVITNKEQMIYKECINKNDSLKFKNLIVPLINEEFKHIVKLYKDFYSLPIDKDIKDIILLKV